MELIWHPFKHVKENKHTFIHPDNPNNPMFFFFLGHDGMEILPFQRNSLRKTRISESLGPRYAAEFTRLRGLAWAELESLKVPVDDPGKTWAEVPPRIQKRYTRRGRPKDLGCGFCLYIGWLCVFFLVWRKTLKSSYKGGLLLCNERNERTKNTHYTASKARNWGLKFNSIPQLRKLKPLDFGLFLSFRRLSLFLVVFCSESHLKTTLIFLVLHFRRGFLGIPPRVRGIPQAQPSSERAKAAQKAFVLWAQMDFGFQKLRAGTGECRRCNGPGSKWLGFQLVTRWWFQIFFIFYPYLGKIPNLTNIFQMDWNHQPGYKLKLRTLISLADTLPWGFFNDPLEKKRKHT